MTDEWGQELPPPNKPDGVLRLGPDLRPRLWRQHGGWCLATYSVVSSARGPTLLEHAHTSGRPGSDASVDVAAAWAAGKIGGA